MDDHLEINAGSACSSISFTHPTRNAASVAAHFDATFEIARSAGEPRVMNARTTLPGIFGETYCVLDLPETATASASDVAEAFLAWAEPRADAMQSFLEDGGRVSLMGTLAPLSTIAFVMSSQLMARLAQTGADIGFNVVPPQEETP